MYKTYESVDDKLFIGNINMVQNKDWYIEGVINFKINSAALVNVLPKNIFIKWKKKKFWQNKF